MQNNYKISTLMLGISLLAVSPSFAMDTMKDDKMMKDKTATGTMMMDDKMKMNDEKMMMIAKIMKITRTSPRSDVALLQQFLIDEGYLKLRKGTRLGFYGPLTITAFKKYEENKMMEKEKMMMKEGDTMMKQ